MLLLDNKEHPLERFLCLFRLNHLTTADGGEGEKRKKVLVCMCWSEVQQDLSLYLFLSFPIFIFWFKAFIHLWHKVAISFSPNMSSGKKKRNKNERALKQTHKIDKLVYLMW